MKFLHTADWQIGMRAAQVGESAVRVREERLAAACQDSHDLALTVQKR